jgi:glutamyl-tRNA synthetase
MTVRVRFAPSPTGKLHIGGARTALSNYLYARQHGGVHVLRIEDTDPERSRKEHEEQILRDLSWLGIGWDEGPDIGGPFGPYRQSERMDRYQAIIDDLLAKDLAYRCNATKEELDEMREAQRARGEDPRYDRRNRDARLGPDCGPHVIRLKLPVEGTTVVHDLIKGDVEVANTKLDDFVIQRTDGAPTYNFVVVVDDIDMNITHVVRGDDHINNTPKQIHVYRALNAELPRFAHLPMILGQDGSRLSKRHGHTSLGAYRELGIIKEAMLNYLARLGWSHGDQEIFDHDELVSLFGLEAIGKSGAQWDMAKLTWLNETWIRRLEPADLAARSRPFLEARGLTLDDDRLEAAVVSVQKRASTLVDLAEQAEFYFVDAATLEYEEKATKKWWKAATGPLLADFAARLSALEDWSEAGMATMVEEFCTHHAIKMGKIAQPARIALTGRGQGPGLYEMLLGLGRDRSVRRVQRAADHCPSPA